MKNKMKVVFIANIEHGGITTVLSHVLSSESIQKEYEMSLFLFKHSNYTEKIKYLKDIVPVNNSKSTNKIFNTIRLINFLIKYNGDAVVCLGPIQVKVAKKIKQLFNKKYKVISWLHLTSKDPSISSKFNNLKYADYNLAISTGIKKELMSLNIPENKIGLIFNPISRKDKTIIANNKNDKCKFIYIGRTMLDDPKNFRGLLKCLSQLNGNWELDVYGTSYNEKEIEDIINNNSNLMKKVNLKGWTKSPFDDIKNADVLLLNSNYEGLPMVIAEAMSYGIPAISSNCPTGPDDLIKQNKNGYLYEVGDYKELTNYLNKFINHQVKFNTNDIKNSINFLYEDNYNKNFIDKLRKGIKNG